MDSEKLQRELRMKSYTDLLKHTLNMKCHFSPRVELSLRIGQQTHLGLICTNINDSPGVETSGQTLGRFPNDTVSRQ